ncbi:MAG: hypothetical protein WEB87_03310 [Bacteriovoracaceae bacterium]
MPLRVLETILIFFKSQKKSRRAFSKAHTKDSIDPAPDKSKESRFLQRIEKRKADKKKNKTGKESSKKVL